MSKKDILCAEGGQMTETQLAEHRARWAEMNPYHLCEERKRLAADFGEKHVWAALYGKGELEMTPPENPMDRHYSTMMYEGERIDAQVLFREFITLYPDSDPASACLGVTHTTIPPKEN